MLLLQAFYPAGQSYLHGFFCVTALQAICSSLFRDASGKNEATLPCFCPLSPQQALPLHPLPLRSDSTDLPSGQYILPELPDNRYSSTVENVPVLQVSVLYHLLPFLQGIHIYRSESPDDIPESADTHTLSPRNVPHLRNYKGSPPTEVPGRKWSQPFRPDIRQVHILHPPGLKLRPALLHNPSDNVRSSSHR